MNTVNDSPNRKSTVEERSLPTRRDFVKTTAVAAASLAAGSLISCRSTTSSARLVKIGFVSPKTGPLAAFTEADDFVLTGVRKLLADGIVINGTKHPVVILEKDSQSDSNRAAVVASDLIKTDKVDLLLAADSPDTVNPVSDQAELNSIPCINSTAPWNPWYFGRGGTPEKGFDWTYLFCWGSENIVPVYTDLWEMIPTNKVVGALWGNDADGIAYSDAARGFPPILKKLGYTVIDTGRFSPSINDFSAQISAFKRAKVEILTAVFVPPAFSTFWDQAAQQGFRPKIATVAKALLFPTAVAALGDRGINLSTEVWWSPHYPFKSGLTGQTCGEFCAEYEAKTGRQWTQPLGFSHALFEVAIDVLKRTKDINSPASIRDAIVGTNYASIFGPISWTKNPYGNPVKNVSVTPVVGGQWVKDTKFKYDLVLVNNKRAPEIPVQAGLLPLP